MKCPRCGSTDFRNVECESEDYYDGIIYTSDICNICGLYLSGWTNKWLIDCEWWQDEDDCEEFKGKEIINYKLIYKKVKKIINDWTLMINDMDADEYLEIISEIIEEEERKK